MQFFCKYFLRFYFYANNKIGKQTSKEIKKKGLKKKRKERRNGVAHESQWPVRFSNLHLLRFRLLLFTYNALLITFMSLPTKRSITDNNATSAATDTSSSAARSPPMKKAKNGLQHHPQQDCNLNPSHDVVFDPNSMALDDDLKADDPTALPNARSVMAANLSRKKATPPQPPRTKKLAIKLHKGKASISSFLICNC